MPIKKVLPFLLNQNQLVHFHKEGVWKQVLESRNVIGMVLLPLSVSVRKHLVWLLVRGECQLVQSVSAVPLSFMSFCIGIDLQPGWLSAHFSIPPDQIGSCYSDDKSSLALSVPIWYNLLIPQILMGKSKELGYCLSCAFQSIVELFV